MRTFWLSLGAAASVAAVVLLTGCVGPDTSGGVTPVGQSTATATRSASPTPSATPTPAPTATSEPTYTPLPPAEGQDPAPSDEWTTESVYQTCVDAPDADPANPISAYSPVGQSRVDQSGPGYWLVVIPVTRASGAGQQVCYIDGEPASPNVQVAPAL